MASEVKITLVSLEQPCTACLIIEDHLKEMLGRLEKRLDYISTERIVLKDLKGVHSIEGLEIEKFPALLINSGQITAGSLPHLDQLLAQIRKEAKS